MATFLQVDSICTDADLASKVGGADALDRINSSVAARDIFRASALDDVIGSLLTRSPPVFDTDLTYPTELKLAVCFRALSNLFFAEMTSDGDRNHVLAKKYELEFMGAVRARFTVSAGQISPSGTTFSYERR